MTYARPLAVIILIPFTALTAYAIYDVGFLGVFEHQLAASGGWQVFTDLAIALLINLLWIVPDARKTGRNPWPYVALTLVLGSFGPLLYLLLKGKPPPAP